VSPPASTRTRRHRAARREPHAPEGFAGVGGPYTQSPLVDKTFRPQSVEPKWRQRWEELGIGRADPDSPRRKFVIALPPPNITGALHMGHACGFSIQDALSRYHRMLGDEVEWCPGTDHAAIATQNVIERQLATEGTTKEQLGREQFQARVDAWYQEYGGRIYEQMRRLGFTCDWSRSRFTLDPEYVRSIRTVFKGLYDEGLIYRGPRIVNWCPHDRSAISDEEIDWQEHHDTLYYLRYPVEGGDYIVVATVRPETMLGDTGVAVAPGDKRWTHLVGRHAVIPLVSREVPIFEDPDARADLGSGALKVTPGHDPTDYEIGRRHALPIITVIAPDGTMDIPELPQFHGLPVEQARQRVADALRQIGALVKTEEYVHDVGHCDRCGHVLEPLVSDQWWVRMASLAAPGIAAAETGEVSFHPTRYTDVYLRWMRNIRDWCISRQIWLGHAIPVSTCGNGHQFAWIDPPSACPQCGDTQVTNDPDVLDTWFSSSLWPFAIFGWPERTRDYEAFYPTNVLVTARDIIFLWVARMIMMGIKFTDRLPFTDVLITSTIQATDGSRMSKSKGTAIDPLVMIERYGADAVRAWAAAVGTGGQDVRFDEDRIASYQRFANKLWNVTTGVLLARLGSGADSIPVVDAPDPETLEPEDRWMLTELANVVAESDSGFAAFRFHDTMERLYDTTWHAYCDWYAEMIKPRLQEGASPASRHAAAWTAVTVLDTLVRLLHPFMPFVTEECAQLLPDAAPTLQQRPWPRVDPLWTDTTARAAHEGVSSLLELVQHIRALRQESGLPASARDAVRVMVHGSAAGLSEADAARLVAALVPASITATLEGGRAVSLVAGPFHAEVSLATPAQDDGHTRRQLDQLDAQIARLRAQLDNQQFVERARADVVEGARRKLDEVTRQSQTLRALLEQERR
jgi:valyl-tRNA synthetase